MDAIELTPAAVTRIKSLQAKRGGCDLKLRVTVLGGGCSGFQYQFGFEDAAQDDDLVYTTDGVSLLVDQVSYDLLRGAQIDFVNDLIGAAFRIHNPNATAACGCGNSFSI